MLLALLGACATSACASRDPGASAEPPPRTKAMMDRLTVPHRYDPATGNIVARRTVALLPPLEGGPALPDAVRQSTQRGVPLVVFATADRCAPCQQFKNDALRDPRVLTRLSSDRLIATHVEVDRHADDAQTYLGGAGIPVTYVLRDGKVVASMLGMRSADELLAFLDAQGV